MDIDAATNRVTVGPEDALYRERLWVSRVNYTVGQPPSEAARVNARIRYKASDASATLLPGGDWAEVRFDEPQRAVTPGQPVVFYDGDRVIGGGYIETRPPAAVPAAAVAETPGVTA